MREEERRGEGERKYRKEGKKKSEVKEMLCKGLGGSSGEQEPQDSELGMEDGRGKQRKVEPGWAQDFIPGQRKLVKGLGRGECDQSSHYNLWG